VIGLCDEFVPCDGFRSPPGRAQEYGPRRQPWGESRADAPEKPREGRKSGLDDRRSSVATTWLSVVSVCRDPTAVALGHILAPLTRLSLGSRAYSIAYIGRVFQARPKTKGQPHRHREHEQVCVQLGRQAASLWKD